MCVRPFVHTASPFVHTNCICVCFPALLELETAGDVAPLPLYSSFGETPLEVPDGDLVEYPSPFWYIATGNTATATTSVLTIDRHHYKHASRTHGAAALLRERITFLKNSRLFTSLPHADVVALAGMLVKETFKEKEVLCVAGETAHCFFFILTGEVLSAPELRRSLRPAAVCTKRGSVAAIAARVEPLVDCSTLRVLADRTCDMLLTNGALHAHKQKSAALCSHVCVARVRGPCSYMCMPPPGIVPVLPARHRRAHAR